MAGALDRWDPVQPHHLDDQTLCGERPETLRTTLDVTISAAAMRQSDLLAFELAIESSPGSVMCSFTPHQRTLGLRE
jgi:hypothetical protein